ncbi:hypothetical protein GCM10009715_28170 [Paeniglutamicibacter psychrophenolicus]|uniref:Uncharacterized protein n=1 Tax=Paeniglutamicibacter psychrophenolicus TaxID=257454 RepID=A0ABS4WGR9_9MICC|nr:hypothetical protein [Paeniglutamicibacter psychrophenolicus]MBP2374769.1 hypothetical protein [Paeniglutamicibacter psychrophenolicus]
MKINVRPSTGTLWKLLIAWVASIGLIMTLGVGAARAATDIGVGTPHPATNVAVDAGWQEFITLGIGIGSEKGPYNFTSTSLVKITVTDAFCHGDQFGVYDNNVLLGDTSEVAPDVVCVFKLYIPAVARADAAILDPGYSQGTFFVAPGEHSLDFVNRVLWNETAAGTGAYFRLDSVQLTKSDCLDGGWQDFGSVFKNQGSCVSLAQQPVAGS